MNTETSETFNEDDYNNISLEQLAQTIEIMYYHDTRVVNAITIKEFILCLRKYGTEVVKIDKYLG